MMHVEVINRFCVPVKLFCDQFYSIYKIPNPW